MIFKGEAYVIITVDKNPPQPPAAFQVITRFRRIELATELELG